MFGKINGNSLKLSHKTPKRLLSLQAATAHLFTRGSEPRETLKEVKILQRVKFSGNCRPSDRTNYSPLQPMKRCLRCVKFHGIQWEAKGVYVSIVIYICYCVLLLQSVPWKIKIWIASIMEIIDLKTRYNIVLTGKQIKNKVKQHAIKE